jgi:hypothetical protein
MPHCQWHYLAEPKIGLFETVGGRNLIGGSESELTSDHASSAADLD